MPVYYAVWLGRADSAACFYGELRSVAEYVVPDCRGKSDALHFYSELRSVAV